jgi:hypothetical protein
LSTPTPSLGKNVAGGYMRQRPSAIQAVGESGSGSGLVFMAVLLRVVSPPGWRVRCGCPEPSGDADGSDVPIWTFGDAVRFPLSERV